MKVNNMTWDFYGDGDEFILKEKKQLPKKRILDSLDDKARKRLKRLYNQQNLLNSLGKILLNWVN